MQSFNQLKNNTIWISCAKGIGIILVVTGHYHTTSSPDYWIQLCKISASFFFELQNAVNTTSIYDLMFYPHTSYMPLLWFIHSLFLIGKAMHFFPFFIVGKTFRRHIFSLQNIHQLQLFFLLVATSLFVILSTSFLDGSYITGKLLYFYTGITGSTIVITVSMLITTNFMRFNLIGSGLIYIGTFSMSIYLFHTLFESFVRIFFYQILKQQTL